MILCCGEALIDMIPAATSNGEAGFVPHSGGAVFNTAIALGRLGVSAGMLTGLSNDLFGEQLISALQESRVDTSHVIVSGRPTTLAFVKLIEGQASYSFFDENSAGRMLGPEDLPALSPQVSGLFFGGISLACEPCGETYTHLARQAAASRVVMLDPNIRTRFIGDIDRYRPRLDEMIGLADIVKISDEDLHWIYPGNQPLAEKMERILAAGPTIVILTRGGEGAAVTTCQGIHVSAPAERVQVADTIGAGDTFNAGFLARISEHGLLEKETLRSITPEALHDATFYGNRAAAITVSRPGANPPWRHEVNCLRRGCGRSAANRDGSAGRFPARDTSSIDPKAHAPADGFAADAFTA
ncbi:carbohydrate kinase [Sinorhizobium meliloti]|uniref:carbohydrate kinase family protein n=1 Tax=Rhizobium meliloti TaxID=382 RepID=UPI0029ACE81E|nr:carbohydrate kinase [Sinorhizobium meliloti]